MEWIWGKHSVEQALWNSPEHIIEVLVEDGADSNEFSAIEQEARRIGVAVKQVPHLPSPLKEKRTQGIAAQLKRFPFFYFNQEKEQLSEQFKQGNRQWAVLDGIEDPRNYGAILRSAAAFGVSAIFVGQKRQAPLSGVVAQASAGQVFRVPIYLCSSLGQVVQLANEAGVQVAALSGASDNVAINDFLSAPATLRPVMWVLGSEGKGIRPALEGAAHAKVGIPMQEGVESLNVSVAAALTFYLTHQRLLEINQLRNVL